MTDNINLVDELERLQVLKKNIDNDIERIKDELISQIKEDEDSVIISGTNKDCTVKEYEKVIYPEDKSELINSLKEKGLYNEFSIISYAKLGPRILKKEIDEEIINLITKEKAYRISLKKKS